MRLCRMACLWLFGNLCTLHAHYAYFCVNKAQPYETMQCLDNEPYCYTIENNKSIAYGCVGSTSSLLLHNDSIYSQCPEKVHAFCPSDEGTGLLGDEARLCCCEASECNGLALLESTIDASNKSLRPNQRLTRRIFKRGKTADVEAVPRAASNTKWFIIGGVGSAVVGILLLAGFGTVVVSRRNNTERLSAIGDVLDSSDKSDEEDVENEGMECGPGKKCSSVMHVNRTRTLVPAMLSARERTALLRSFSNEHEMKTVKRGRKAPTICGVVTYSTTDQITSTEDSSRHEESMRKEIASSERWFGSNAMDSTTSLLARMIANGPRQYPFKADELKDLIRRGTEIFVSEPSLLEVPLPCIVYGDIHGQYSDLHRWFNLNGWPWKRRSVFLGDFVDRGSHGVEVIALLTALKVAFPDRLFICRGNHEEESLNRVYSFFDEMRMRFPLLSDDEDNTDLYGCVKDLFSVIPLAVLIGGRILGMHGGISPQLTSLQAIRNIKRPMHDFEVGSLACDLVWSDPDTSPQRSGFRPNLEREPSRGIGQLFGSDTVQQICNRLNIELIIRGHQAPLQGYGIFSDGCLMTLFSAPGYKGTNKDDINMGASLHISANMNITIKRIEVTEKFRHNRIDDVNRMRQMAKQMRQCK